MFLGLKNEINLGRDSEEFGGGGAAPWGDQRGVYSTHLDQARRVTQCEIYPRTRTSAASPTSRTVAAAGTGRGTPFVRVGLGHASSTRVPYLYLVICRTW